MELLMGSIVVWFGRMAVVLYSVRVVVWSWGYPLLCKQPLDFQPFVSRTFMTELASALYGSYSFQEQLLLLRMAVAPSFQRQLASYAAVPSIAS